MSEAARRTELGFVDSIWPKIKEVIDASIFALDTSSPGVEGALKVAADIALTKWRESQAVSLPDRETIKKVLEDSLWERGNIVAEWPEDEAEAYRSIGFMEGREAAREIAFTKAADAVLAALSNSPEIPDSSRAVVGPAILGVLGGYGLDVEQKEQIVGDALDALAALSAQPAGEQVRAVQGWMALDLHMALGKEPDMRSEVENQGHGSWADWWAELCGEVRALSTRPAAGEGTETVWHKDQFYVTIETDADGQVTISDELLVKLMTESGWVLQTRTQPEPQPTELDALFPGTLAALDNLNIRPEVQ